MALVRQFADDLVSAAGTVRVPDTYSHPRAMSTTYEAAPLPQAVFSQKEAEEYASLKQQFSKQELAKERKKKAESNRRKREAEKEHASKEKRKQDLILGSMNAKSGEYWKIKYELEKDHGVTLPEKGAIPPSLVKLWKATPSDIPPNIMKCIQERDAKRSGGSKRKGVVDPWKAPVAKKTKHHGGATPFNGLFAPSTGVGNFPKIIDRLEGQEQIISNPSQVRQSLPFLLEGNYAPSAQGGNYTDGSGGSISMSYSEGDLPFPENWRSWPEGAWFKTTQSRYGTQQLAKGADLGSKFRPISNGLFFTPKKSDYQGSLSWAKAMFDKLVTKREDLQPINLEFVCQAMDESGNDIPLIPTDFDEFEDDNSFYSANIKNTQSDFRITIPDNYKVGEDNVLFPVCTKLETDLVNKFPYYFIRNPADPFGDITFPIIYGSGFAMTTAPFEVGGYNDCNRVALWNMREAVQWQHLYETHNGLFHRTFQTIYLTELGTFSGAEEETRKINQHNVHNAIISNTPDPVPLVVQPPEGKIDSPADTEFVESHLGTTKSVFGFSIWCGETCTPFWRNEEEDEFSVDDNTVAIPLKIKADQWQSQMRIELYQCSKDTYRKLFGGEVSTETEIEFLGDSGNTTGYANWEDEAKRLPPNAIPREDSRALPGGHKLQEKPHNLVLHPGSNHKIETHRLPNTTRHVSIHHFSKTKNEARRRREGEGLGEEEEPPSRTFSKPSYPRRTKSSQRSSSNVYNATSEGSRGRKDTPMPSPGRRSDGNRVSSGESYASAVSGGSKE